MKANALAADYIQPLNMNGLDGRLLHVPAAKQGQREILLLYGHHALLERWWGLVENLTDYGTVTMPDLPGFGGMDSFSKIGQKPTLDNYADYLAAFVKLRYKRKRVTIIGISYGFLVATRMLQRYPELVSKVDVIISIVGFMHGDDFFFSPKQKKFYRFGVGIFALQPIAWIIRYFFLNKFFIKLIYVRLPAGRRRFIVMTSDDFKRMMDFEVALWQQNDVHTHWYTTRDFLAVDNCRKAIGLPVWHVAAKHDHYFDNGIVEQHMRVVFTDYHGMTMNSPAHTPSIVGNKKELSIMLPPKLRRFLASS